MNASRMNFGTISYSENTSTEYNQLQTDYNNLKNNVKWMSRSIGEVVYIWDHFTGADIPATDNSDYRFIKLTASDSYNTGLIINETASNVGTPESIYLGTIDSSNSPLNGEIIHMINSEQSMIRPRAGASGVLQNDTVQRIQGIIDNLWSWDEATSGDLNRRTGLNNKPDPGANPAINLDLDSSLTVRTDISYDETRVKNIGATAYLRIY